MSKSPDILIGRLLTMVEAVGLSQVSFGNEPYQTELNDWLGTEAELFLQKEKGVVWGYFNHNMELVVFSDFGLDTWKFE